MALFREKPFAIELAPLMLAIPVVTLVNCLTEDAFSRHLAKWLMPALAVDGRSRIELEMS